MSDAGDFPNELLEYFEENYKSFKFQRYIIEGRYGEFSILFFAETDRGIFVVGDEGEVYWVQMFVNIEERIKYGRNGILLTGRFPDKSLYYEVIKIAEMGERGKDDICFKNK